MDPTILELFTPEEILDRLGQRKGSGCLHVFSPRESAHIYLKEGMVVATANGAVEGVEVLKKVVQWKDAHYSWQVDADLASLSLKPLRIPISEFLAQIKPKSATIQKIGTEAATLTTAPAADALPIFKTIRSKGKATGQITPLEAPGQGNLASFHATQPVPLSSISVEHTATKDLSSGATRSAHDTALLHKHKLALVSVENREQRFRISRVSGLVGRNPACDFPIQHPSISRQHCLLQILDRGLNVKDLGATNGTKVNGIPLSEGYVNIGDKLTIGHLTFVVEKDTSGA